MTFHPSDSKDETLREVLRESFDSDATPSNALRERVAKMAEEHGARPVRAPSQAQRPRARLKYLRRPRVRWALSLGVAGLALGGTALYVPRVVSARAWARVEAAMAKVSNVHTVRWRLKPDGSREKIGESWFSGGRRREEEFQDGALRTAWIWKDGRRWSYDARLNTVTTRRNERPFSRPSSGFTLDAIVKDLGEDSTVKILGASMLDGRRVKRVRVESSNNIETTRFDLLVDEESDLPIRGEVHIRARGGEEARWAVEISYHAEPRASLFEPRFAPGARLVDADREEADLTTRLARGIARQKVGEREIVVRDVQANRRGEVFVLYSAGKKLGDAFGAGVRVGGRDWKVFLSDDRGTRYKWMGPDPLWLSMDGGRIVDGARLEGEWWIPAEPLGPGEDWRSRTFTLRFEVSPRNLHGPSRTEFGRVALTQERIFRVPVWAPATPGVPLYAKTLLPHGRDESLRAAASRERGELAPGVEPSPQLERHLARLGDSVGSLAFSPDGKAVAGAAWNGGTIFWEAATGREMKRVHGNGARFSPDGREVLVARPLSSRDDEDKLAVRRVEVASGRQVAAWNTRGRGRGGGGIFADDKTLRAAESVVTDSTGTGRDKIVQSMDVVATSSDARTGRLLFAKTLGHDDFVTGTSQAFAGGRWLIATSQSRRADNGTRIGGLARVWDARAGQVLAAMSGTETWDAKALALSPDGTRLAVIGYDVDKDGVGQGNTAEVRIYDAATGARQLALEVESAHTRALAWAPDGTMLAAGSEGGQIKIWDASSGAEKHALVGHANGVQQIAWAPDASRLASGDLKGKVLLWKLKPAQPE